MAVDGLVGGGRWDNPSPARLVSDGNSTVSNYLPALGNHAHLFNMTFDLTGIEGLHRLHALQR